MEYSEKELKIQIGKRIDSIRIEKGLTKDKLAKMLGISPQHLGHVIKGNSGLSVEKIAKLSKGTGYTTDYIIMGKESNIDKGIKELFIVTRKYFEEGYKNLETIESIMR